MFSGFCMWSVYSSNLGWLLPFSICKGVKMVPTQKCFQVWTLHQDSSCLWLHFICFHVFFRAKDARTREFFEKCFPEIKKSREDKERLSRSEFTSDYYTSFLVLTHVYMWLLTVDNYSSFLSSNSAWIIIFIIVIFSCRGG